MLTIIYTVLFVVIILALLAAVQSRAPGTARPPDASPPPSKFSVTPGSMESQRNKMRELFTLHGADEDKVIEAYAAAEVAGEVQRRSNDYGLNPNAYARRLYADGVAKGWIHERCK